MHTLTSVLSEQKQKIIGNIFLVVMVIFISLGPVSFVFLNLKANTQVSLDWVLGPIVMYLCVF